MLHTGLVSVSFRKLSPAEVLRLVVEAGLEGIEWGGDVHVPPVDLENARHVAKMTEDAGVKVAAYGSYYRLGVRDQAPFKAVLETAAALSAPAIRVWAGTQNSADAAEEDWSRVVADGQRVADLAAAVGLTVSFEFHDQTLNNNAAGTVRLMESIRRDNVRTLWQPPVDAAPEDCLVGLRTVLPWLGNLHVFCWRPGYERLPLAAGAAEWLNYFEVAASTQRDRFCLLEFVRDDSPDAFLEDARTLKTWLNKRAAERD